MRAIWTLADVDGGIISFIIILAVIVINVIKLAMRRSKDQEEDRRRAAAKPKSAPETGTAARTVETATGASVSGKGTAAREVDRFFEELARQSGAPVPPRRPAPAPKPPVTAAPPPRAAAPAAHVPTAAAKPHTHVPVHHAPSARPQSAEAAMLIPMALSVEPEPDADLPAMTHLSPLAQAMVLREILGPCRAFRPHRNRARGW
jgi:hypothetical protein